MTVLVRLFALCAVFGCCPAQASPSRFSPPPAGVTDLKFAELFRMPVGPKGLEPSDKLLSLNGKRVRLLGYMVREQNAAGGRLMLSPLPVALGDEDDKLSDDLPASTVFVHLAGDPPTAVPFIGGLIQLTGILEVGNQDERDARVSAVRLRLDPQVSRWVLKSSKPIRAPNHS